MKNAVFVVVVSVALMSCSGFQLPKVAENDSGESDQVSADSLADQEFVAYDNMTVESVHESLYELKFVEPQSIESALRQAKQFEIPTTHVFIKPDGRPGGGAFATYQSYNSSGAELESRIRESLMSAASRLLQTYESVADSGELGQDQLHEIRENTLAEVAWLENPQYVVTGIQAVIPQSGELSVSSYSAAEGFADIFQTPVLVYSESSSDPTSPSQSDDEGAIGASSSCTHNFNRNYLPDWHEFRILAAAPTRPNRRYFEWSGCWLTQDRLDSMHNGPEPAFEPDLVMKCKDVSLVPGTGTAWKGWAKPDPRDNADWWGNLPHDYIDTQASDWNWRSWTVGSTAAEQFDLNTIYLTQIWSKDGSATNNKWKKWRTSWNTTRIPDLMKAIRGWSGFPRGRGRTTRKRQQSFAPGKCECRIQA